MKGKRKVGEKRRKSEKGEKREIKINKGKNSD